MDMKIPVVIGVILFLLLSSTYSEERDPLELELWKDEVTLRSGQRLNMNMSVKNTSFNVIHTECIKSRVVYNTLGDIVVNKTTIEWKREVYPYEICEGVHHSNLPLYTLPGTYTITIWVEYEGGKSDEVQLILHYNNFYFWLILACIANFIVLYFIGRYKEIKTKRRTK